MKRSIAASCGLASLVLLSACSSSSTAGNSPQSAHPSPSPTSANRVINVKLAHMPTGTASLTWDNATRIITAKLDMYGFTPNSHHAMHIHQGSCLNQQNPPVVPFPDIVADATGAVKADVTSKAVAAGIPATGYLNIHLAPGAQLGAPGGVNFTPIACADIPAGSVATGPVDLTMQAPPQPGQSPQGTATLTYDAADSMLKVEVKLTGLPPGSVHAEHIHSGSCMSQGAVLHPLTDLNADAAGDVDVTTTLPNIPSPFSPNGWYVNVHMAPSSGIVANGSPTLMFAPIVCGDITP